MWSGRAMPILFKPNIILQDVTPYYTASQYRRPVGGRISHNLRANVGPVGEWSEWRERKTVVREARPVSDQTHRRAERREGGRPAPHREMFHYKTRPQFTISSAIPRSLLRGASLRSGRAMAYTALTKYHITRCDPFLGRIRPRQANETGGVCGG